MRKYELVILLDAKTSAAKKKKTQETIEKVVDLLKGKVGKVEDWGEKDTGIYLFFPLELGAGSVKELSIKLKGESDIVKYLLTRKE